MAPSSSAIIIGGHAAARCGGEGGTSPRVCLGKVLEALCFLRHLLMSATPSFFDDDGELIKPRLHASS